MNKFIISGFSDEISSDIVTQFKQLNSLGIEYFEPRGINGKNISDLTTDEALELKNTMDAYHIKASSIGSPIGKILITDDFLPHLEKFKHTVEIAKILDAKYIRIFSFFIPEGECADQYAIEVYARLSKMANIAEKEHIILLHENEKGIFGDTVSRCKDIFVNVPSPNLKGVFDPANFVQCGQIPYPHGFNALRGNIEYVHIKDATSDGTVVVAGMGNGHLPEILHSLANDGYHGFLSLEPHLGSFSGLEALELQNTMLQLEKSDADKFIMAYNALLKII